MKRSLFIIASLLLLPLAEQVTAQPAKDRRLPAIIYRTDGTGTSGYIAGVDERALLLESLERVPLDSIAKVEVITNVSDLGAWSGILGAIYLTYVAPSDFAGKSTGSYIESDELLGRSWVAAIFGMVAGGIGKIADGKKAERKETFDLRRDPDERERLVQYVRRRGRPRLEITLNGGLVFARNTPRMGRELIADGFNQSGFDADGASLAVNSGSYEMLRRAQITYGVSPDLDLGAAWVNLREPGLSGARTDSLADRVRYIDLTEHLEGDSFFAIATWRPRLLSELGLDLAIGGGVGFGTVDLYRDLTVRETFYDPNASERYVNSDHLHSVMAPGGLVVAELVIPLRNWIVLGITADYMLLTTIDISGESNGVVPNRTLTYNNGSVGLLLGWRF